MPYKMRFAFICNSIILEIYYAVNIYFHFLCCLSSLNITLLVYFMTAVNNAIYYLM